MAETIEPMTAAEWVHYGSKSVSWVQAQQNGLRIAAALEERERLLGEREVDAPFAAVGRGLVGSSCTGVEWDRLLAAARAAWDSLLPKEPEVVTGPSGRQYRMRDGGVEVQSADQLAGTINSWWVKLHPWSAVVTQDAPVVAKLMEGAR